MRSPLRTGVALTGTHVREVAEVMLGADYWNQHFSAAEEPRIPEGLVNRDRMRRQTPMEPDLDPIADDDAEAEEGQILTRVHKTRERNRRLRERKKAEALEAEGRLACEACGFDFAAHFGERGDGYIECHHTVPLSRLRPGTRTRLTDLALVCANCHRIIHRRAPWLTMDELRALVS